MKRLHCFFSTLICALFTMFLVLIVPTISQGQAPARSAASTARSADLLKSEPFDRLTLSDNSIVDVEPVSPRPLPALDPNKKEKKVEPPPPPRRKSRKVDDTAAEQTREDEAKRLEEADNLIIRTLEGEIRDYKVKYRSIRKIEYYEDMLIADADKLTKAHEFVKAFERIITVRKRAPGWPGIDERMNKLLLTEGETAVVEADPERGLRLLRELYGRKKDYPGLAEALASAYGGRIQKALEFGAYAQGRRVLHDLELLAPEHPLIKTSTERFVVKAKGYADKAESASGVQKLDDWTEALKIWPKLDGGAAKFKEAFQAEPTLTVGVIDLPRPLTPWARSSASARGARLVYLPILADLTEESTTGARVDQLAGRLTKGELGLRLSIELKSGIPWSDGSRAVSAIDVARSLIDRAEPRSPGYDARWADLLQSVATPDDLRVEVVLTRSVLNPESWFLEPIGPAHADRDGLVPIQGQGRRPIGDGPFRLDSATADKGTYLAVGTQPSLKIRRVVEVHYPDTNAVMNALLRGDITLLEHLNADRVASLKANSQFQIGTYARPSLHRIAIDGRNPALRNRTLRRAIAVAIDRKTLLEETILKHPIDGVNLPADGPFAKGTYADATGVKPIPYDPLLARMLVAAAKRELGGAPLKLKFEYPAHPEVQACVGKMLEMLKLAGLDIEAVERPEADLEVELRSGRRFDLAYRINRCVEPSNEAGVLICPGFDSAPGTAPLGSVASSRILQLLLELDRAESSVAARVLLLQIDRESRDELPIIPLWQLQDHYAWRTRLTGPAETTEFLYQHISTWEVAPWFPLDPW